MNGFLNQSKLVLTATVAIAAWLVFAHEGISNAVGIWYGNDIFNHGFLILPAVVYFIYAKRGLWLNQSLKTTSLPLMGLFSCVFLYVVGYAGDVMLFKHAAAFLMLPLMFWMFVGHKAAYALLFPLFFVVFTIPIGEQLIPRLQEITADVSVFLLKLSGIPLFRSGLYIEIPQGRFLVAEACSGISFFIASIVVGCVYSYLNFTSTKKRIGFMLLSIGYPILANALRVYGIILIAYLTDMEHAAGADHIIYGWFFFAIVLLSLLVIGEWVRDKDAVWEVPLTEGVKPQLNISYPVIIAAIAIILAGAIWLSWLKASKAEHLNQPPSYIAIPTNFEELPEQKLVDYRPSLVNPADTFVVIDKEHNSSIIYQAWFNGGKSELISGLHRLYDQQSWSLIREQTIETAQGIRLIVKQVTTPNGQRRLIASWYVVNNNVFSQAIPAKLYQTWRALLGDSDAGLMVIVSLPYATENAGEHQAQQMLHGLIDALQTEGKDE